MSDPRELLKEARAGLLDHRGQCQVCANLIHSIDSALAARDKQPTESLRDPDYILQHAIKAREALEAAREKQVELVPAGTFDPAHEPPWHKTDVAPKQAEPIAYVSKAALQALKDKSILGPIPVFTEPFGENTIPLCSHDAPRDSIPREMRDILIRHARREALRQAAESAEHDYALYTAVDFATELRRMADEVS